MTYAIFLIKMYHGHLELQAGRLKTDNYTHGGRRLTYTLLWKKHRKNKKINFFTKIEVFEKNEEEII